MGEVVQQKAKRWLEDLAEGRFGQRIGSLSLRGLRIKRVQEGLILCNFVIPKHLSDKDGNWHIGAMATLIDAIGAAAIISSVGVFKASVNLDISYFSRAKIHEEVEIESKVLGHKGRLTSVMEEIRRKENGEMVALGKQWMTSIKLYEIHTSKL